MDVAVWWEKVVHHNKVDFASIGYLYAMQTIELREKRIWVFLDVIIVILQYLPEEFVLGVVDRFDNVLVISREIEEATAFARRSKLGKNVLAGQ